MYPGHYGVHIKFSDFFNARVMLFSSVSRIEIIGAEMRVMLDVGADMTTMTESERGTAVQSYSRHLWS